MAETKEELNIPQSRNPFINSGEELLQWLNENNNRGSISKSLDQKNEEKKEIHGENQRPVLLNRRKLEINSLTSPDEKNYPSGDKKHPIGDTRYPTGVSFLEPLTEEDAEFGLETPQIHGNNKRQVCWSSWQIKTTDMHDCTPRPGHLTLTPTPANRKSKHPKQSITSKLSQTEAGMSPRVGKSCTVSVQGVNCLPRNELCTATTQENVSLRSLADGTDPFADNSQTTVIPLADRDQKVVRESRRGSNGNKHSSRVTNQQKQLEILTKKSQPPPLRNIPESSNQKFDRRTTDEDSNKISLEQRHSQDLEDDTLFEKARVKRKLSSSISPNLNLLFDSRDDPESDIQSIKPSLLRRRSYSDTNLVQKEREFKSTNLQIGGYKPKGILKHSASKRMSLGSSEMVNGLNLPKLTPDIEEQRYNPTITRGEISQDPPEYESKHDAYKLENLVVSPRISHSFKPSDDNRRRSFSTNDLQDRVKSFLEKPIPKNGELPSLRTDKLPRKSRTEQNVVKPAQEIRTHELMNFHTCPHLDIQNTSKVFYHKKEGRCRYLRVPQSPTPPVEWIFEN